MDNVLMETVVLEVTSTDLVEEGSALNAGKKKSIEQDDYEETEYAEDEEGERYVGVNSAFLYVICFVCMFCTNLLLLHCINILLFYFSLF